jgi:hypothetical protein
MGPTVGFFAAGQGGWGNLDGPGLPGLTLAPSTQQMHKTDT